MIVAARPDVIMAHNIDTLLPAHRDRRSARQCFYLIPWNFTLIWVTDRIRSHKG